MPHYNDLCQLPPFNFMDKAAIKEQLQWHNGHQRWELTLWGTNAD